MFEGKSQEELVTLTQRENMAVSIAKELAAFVLEEHVALDSAARPAEAAKHNKPCKCWYYGVSVADLYHAERNHQGLDNRLIEPGPEIAQHAGEIACRERLGGMLRYYHRKAA